VGDRSEPVGDEATVRVRLFASLREAAGTDEVAVEPGALAAVLDELRTRFGEPFATRLAVSSVLVDGTVATAETAVAGGAEVVCLPPVSGGAPLAPSTEQSPSLALLLHCGTR
jgi:sulfur-carrier protein